MGWKNQERIKEDTEVGAGFEYYDIWGKIDKLRVGTGKRAIKLEKELRERPECEILQKNGISKETQEKREKLVIPFLIA